MGPHALLHGASPDCWAAYGEALTREYGDRAFSPVHRPSVDAYAAQHPDQPSFQSIQSVALHLIRLCLLLKMGLPMECVNAAMLAAARPGSKRGYLWLTPSVDRGRTTGADVRRAWDATEHAYLVRGWAGCVWAAWSSHHVTIRR